MTLYRFAQEKYADDLSGTGARIYGGRWNSKGLAAIYTSESVSLAMLEVMAHAVLPEDLKEFFLMTLQVPDSTQVYSIENSKLNKKWKYDTGYTRFIGDSFLRENKYLLLKIPSAVVHTEYNFIINPLHKDFKKVKFVSSRLFEFDNRLINS